MPRRPESTRSGEQQRTLTRFLLESLPCDIRRQCEGCDMPTVNIGSAATAYSQVAGVLAGFAFTSLLFYLQPSNWKFDKTSSRAKGRHDEDGNAHVLVATVLFCRLVALIICSILYGLLASNEPASGLSFTTIFVNGPAFSVSILSMLYATGLAARTIRQLAPMMFVVRWIVALIGPCDISHSHRSCRRRLAHLSVQSRDFTVPRLPQRF